jgi:hypothetical protein
MLKTFLESTTTFHSIITLFACSPIILTSSDVVLVHNYHLHMKTDEGALVTIYASLYLPRYTNATGMADIKGTLKLSRQRKN